MRPSRPFIHIKSNRLEAFADGVFAVVVTLLVLDIRLPEHGEPDVGAWLLLNWRKFLSFFLSFFLTGTYWINHQQTFQSIHRVDRPMLVLNLVFLFFVALLPFSATLIGQHATDPVSPVIYSLNLFFVGLGLYAQQRYAFNHPQLSEATHRPEAGAQRLLMIRSLSPSIVYGGVILSAWAGWGTFCYWLFLGIPLVRSLLNRWLVNPAQWKGTGTKP